LGSFCHLPTGTDRFDWCGQRTGLRSEAPGEHPLLVLVLSGAQVDQFDCGQPRPRVPCIREQGTVSRKGSHDWYSALHVEIESQWAKLRRIVSGCHLGRSACSEAELRAAFGPDRERLMRQISEAWVRELTGLLRANASTPGAPCSLRVKHCMSVLMESLGGWNPVGQQQLTWLSGSR